MKSISLHHILIRRLMLTWLTVSLAVGGGMLLYGISDINEKLVELAVKDSIKITDDAQRLLDEVQNDASRIEKLAADFVRERFVQVAIYNSNHELVIEKVNPKFGALQAEVRRRNYKLVQDGSPHFEHFTLEHQTILQLVTPLNKGGARPAGFFEGVFVVDPEMRSRLDRELAVSLAVILATIFLTTLILYPVILALNREVIAFSKDLLRGNIELMEVLGSAIAKRDSDTNIHNYRVSIYAVRLAESAGLAKGAIRDLIAGAFLHDVGKIGISDSILLKPAKLSEEEFAVMKTHVALGVDILAKSDWLLAARDVVEFHHEKFNGQGYLRGLAGEDIPVSARIFAIVDVFDALTSVRPYKSRMPFDQAMAILRRDRGSHFDPQLIDTFSNIADSIYREVSNVSDAVVEEKLWQLINLYFFPQ